MNAESRRIQNVYLFLLLLNTLAASLIWGINTLFLLDAGLSNTQAFAANAFFSAGMVIFDVPTGIIADMRGRRLSYLLGTLTLAATTLSYLWMRRVAAPFWGWALTSALLGLGFTFFSGAVEAWLVDALTFSGYFRENGTLESILAKGQVVEGVAMLSGSVAGGVIAQAAGLGVPYVIRAAILAVNFVVAYALMRDVGFTPSGGTRPMEEVKRALRGAVEHGLGNRPVRWIMLADLFTSGVGIFVFYAMQPYLLKLYGDERAYALAGAAAALVAGAQIAGGLLVPHVRRLFSRRTAVLLAATSLSALLLASMGLAPRYPAAIALLVVWALMSAAVMPMRQAYLNGLIPSDQRATVLSFDSLIGSSGSAVIQPLLGKAADVGGYPASFACSAAIQVLALPFLWLARRERAASDAINA
jgi:MFS family permease